MSSNAATLPKQSRDQGNASTFSSPTNSCSGSTIKTTRELELEAKVKHMETEIEEMNNRFNKIIEEKDSEIEEQRVALEESDTNMAQLLQDMAQMKTVMKEWETMKAAVAEVVALKATIEMLTKSNAKPNSPARKRQDTYRTGRQWRRDRPGLSQGDGGQGLCRDGSL